jgi:hypothetical protein
MIRTRPITSLLRLPFAAIARRPASRAARGFHMAALAQGVESYRYAHSINRIDRNSGFTLCA